MISFKYFYQMSLEEGVRDREGYVHSSVKAAQKHADKHGKKVVLSAGGYYKVVDKDHPAKQVKPDTDRDSKIAHHQNKIKEIEAKKAKREHNDRQGRKMEQDLTKHRKAIRNMPHHVEV